MLRRSASVTILCTAEARKKLPQIESENSAFSRFRSYQRRISLLWLSWLTWGSPLEHKALALEVRL
jgi:hypothetical protein